jgi:photosystem II stability/assembly factor-like uncharacterized protein
MKSKLLDIILATALFSVVFSGFSYTWNKTSNESAYIATGMSADGRIICAINSGTVLVSTNRGQSWYDADGRFFGAFNQNAVAFSADGAEMIIGKHTGTNRSVLLSFDHGASWIASGLPPLTAYPSAYFVTCSADFTNLIAAIGNGLIYYSTNSGTAWLTSSVPSLDWASIACSADAKRLLAAVNGGGIYCSTNFGADWTVTDLPIQAWKCVCLSGDGQSVGAIGTNTFISRDAGATWMTNGFSGRTILSSADGENWVIAGQQIYTSSDGGMTWSTNLFAESWNAAISADGREIVAASGQGIWIGRTNSTSELRIKSTTGDLELSWLLPSTNLILQQTVDLSTWIAVSNPPVLNFTNLQQEITVPATTDNAFFRLIAQ